MQGGPAARGQQELYTLEYSSAALLLVEPSVGLLKTPVPQLHIIRIEPEWQEPEVRHHYSF